jgi:hypothetical protein
MANSGAVGVCVFWGARGDTTVPYKLMEKLTAEQMVFHGVIAPTVTLLLKLFRRWRLTLIQDAPQATKSKVQERGATANNSGASYTAVHGARISEHTILRCDHPPGANLVVESFLLLHPLINYICSN